MASMKTSNYDAERLALNTQIITATDNTLVDIFFITMGKLVRLDISHDTLNKALEVYKLKFKHRRRGHKMFVVLN